MCVMLGLIPMMVRLLMFCAVAGVELGYGACLVCHYRDLHCLQQTAQRHHTQVFAGGVFRCVCVLNRVNWLAGVGFRPLMAWQCGALRSSAVGVA